MLWFFSSHVIYGCENLTIRKAEHWRIDTFESWFWRRLLRVPWTTRKSNLVDPKGNQPWIFIGRVDAEYPVLWLPDERSWLSGKDPDAGNDLKARRKGMTEDKMVGWHHQLNVHEFEQTVGDSEGQGSLACYSPWAGSQTQLSDCTTTKALGNIRL